MPKLKQAISQQDLLRQTAKTLGLTQVGLAIEMGATLGALEKWMTSENSSSYRKLPGVGYRVIELLLEKHEREKHASGQNKTDPG